MPASPPLTESLRALLDLLIPPCCALCNSEGSVLCPTCLIRLAPEPRAVSRAGLSGFASTTYGDPERELLVAFKERGQHALAKVIAKRMAESYGEELARATTARLLVPIPSAAVATRSRGFTPAHLLAQQLAREMSRWGAFRVSPLLRRAGSGRDQSKLGREARFTNLEMRVTGALRSSRAFHTSSDQVGVILVDDLVTTGASVLTAATTLERAGLRVSHFCAFAETLLRSEN